LSVDPLKKLPSLSIFFPFYNDEGTVQRQIEDAFFYGGKVTDDLEVIAIHGGLSHDRTWEKIMEMKQRYPDLVVVDKQDNQEGYAVIKWGFRSATKEWVFYTDGDAQYHLDDLEKLVVAQSGGNFDLINGFKIRRGDQIMRRFLGAGYRLVSQKIFSLPIRDLDCDFRLIRKSVLDKIELESKDSSILLELVFNIHHFGAKICEVPVSHFRRSYGKSNYNAFSLFREKVIGDFRLYYHFFIERR
jgi:glycosyltransferase involved in cell wall biosynthesis